MSTDETLKDRPRMEEVDRPYTSGEVVAQSRPLAALRHVSKVFGSTTAAADISVEMFAGEVLALVGENGAGKSTCVKMLGGVYPPDGGHVELDGDEVHLHSPDDAHRAGLAVVHQHPGLFGDLSIAENVFAGQMPRTKLGLVDHATMRRESAKWLSMLGLNRSPAIPVSSLSTSEQQLVEIARALASGARVLILDEPTAALSSREVDNLFGVIDKLRARGVALMFVGHRLEEIFRISDRITVLRDGRYVDSLQTRDTSPAEVVRSMVGRELTELYPKADATIGSTVLRLDELTQHGAFTDVSIEVRAGEIVGVAGLVGSGRTEVARALFGITRPTSGAIELDGKRVAITSPTDAMERGIAYVSEDRRGQSVIEEFSVLDNAALPVLRQATRAGMVNRDAQLSLVCEPLEKMRLKFKSYDQPISTLSGGNQQKVVLAKWLATQPRLLIMDEPTQGIDIQAKAEVHRITSLLATQGLAVLLISSDLPELLGMSDRIVVMRNGTTVAEFERDDFDQYEIGLAATGATQDPTTATARDAAREMALGKDDGTSDQQAGAPKRKFTGSTLKTAVFGRREAGLVAALAALALPIAFLNPRFLSASNFAGIGIDTALIGIVALGQLLVMLTRNIDLSVASTIGLTAFLAASILKDNPDVPLVVPVLAAAGAGLLCGLVNGAIVGYGGVPSIVVTLGTLATYRGIDAMLSSGTQVAASDVPDAWLALTRVEPLGISIIMWMGAALFLAVAAALRWSKLGRELYMSGSNPDGARLIGIPLNRRILLAFGLSGLLAGLDGALWASHYATVDGQLANGLELTVVASVVVGGVALRGGYGTVLGVALGTFGLLMIQNALALARVNPVYLQAVFGAAILATITLDAFIARRARGASEVTP